MVLPADSQVLHALHRVASYFTDPVCEAQRMFVKITLMDAMYPEATPAQRTSWKVGNAMGGMFYGCLAILASLPAIGLRAAATSLAEDSFCYRRGVADEQQLTGDLKLFSWNVCGVPGKYVYTDGGLEPWWYRFDAICTKIIAQDAHVVTLYEVFDIQMAERLIARFQATYAHFYFQMGTQACGPNSGQFVMSKIPFRNVNFVRFPQGSLHGRARYCPKGFFTCDTAIARLVATHLQHSEVPGTAVPGEVEARSAEMNQIITSLVTTATVQGEVDARLVPAIITGDLNLDDNEFDCAPWERSFLEIRPTEGSFTWGGDQWCAGQCHKERSGGCNLDHTMVTANKGIELVSTVLVETGFVGNEFRPSAISDHSGLLSVIKNTT